MSSRPIPKRLMLPAALGLSLFGAGCFDDARLGPDGGVLATVDIPMAGSTIQGADGPPAGLADASIGGSTLTLWPYTGTSFDGMPSDPINVIFAGEAHPLQIREALLALDGDRSAYGIPPVPPFDQRWTDIVGGDVQTTYTEGLLGWSGSVVQLKLGNYGPLRVHLRLFRTACPFGASGEWTVGGAHFELQIPGTADHQVLSWEIAEQIVVADLVRSGLLDASVPMVPSGVISETPSFRSIPAVIYNGLPPALVDLLDGPAQPVSADVPLPNDGRATIFRVADSVPLRAGTWPGTASLSYDQIVPKPFCVDGPGQFLHVVGPVEIATLVEMSAEGRYMYRADYVGDLEVTPVDLSGGVPVPVGETRSAAVEGQHLGFLDADSGRITARDRRMVIGPGGPEIRMTHLVVPENGRRLHAVLEQCIASQP